MKYPYNQFIEAVAKVIEKQKTGLTQVVDAPCGNGYTTIELGKRFPEIDFLGVDIENHFLDTKQKNINFINSDIHQFIDNQEVISFFCMINSLYLLPNPIELLSKIFSTLEKNGTFLLIVPNIESPNFKYFNTRNPSVNTFIPEIKVLENELKSIGFQIIETYPIVFTPFYGRWDTKFLFFIRDQYLHWLENRNSKKENRIGSYWVLELRKI
jgi:trans-aconitate methyltransferase